MNNTNGRAVKIKPASKSRVTLVISKTLIKKLKLKALDSEGSVLSNSPNCCIECGGNWMFGSGSDVQLGLNDYLYFTGTGALWIYNYSATNS